MEKIKNDISLCSIHIPKSAGTSFRNILKSVYGRNGVVRLDINVSRKVQINDKAFTGSSLSSGVAVAHGHYSFRQFQQYFDESQDLKVITWLRHPVKRTISLYYYLMEQIHSQVIFTRRAERTMDRMTYSLLEFATKPENCNRMHRFLKGVKLTEMDFVGITEYFDEDIHHLAAIMNWPKVKSLAVNKTRKKGKDIPDDVIEQIEAANQKDMEIYAEAMNLRNERLKAHSNPKV